MLSCKFCETLKNSFFTEHLWTAASEFFHTFYCFLPLSELVSRNHVFIFLNIFIRAFDRDKYCEFCNWKTILCEKKNEGAINYLSKLTKNSRAGASFTMKLHVRACNFIERKLMSLS